MIKSSAPLRKQNKTIGRYVTDLLTPGNSKMHRMTQGEVINYKIYLCAAGYEPEVRRITVDKDMCHNYFYLKSKLICIFPILKDIPFTIVWKDKEGDSVRICTDEELIIALREMESNGFYKLYVSTCPQQGSEGPMHSGVYCDGCSRIIQGFRYKCIICSDFDLCPDCERAQNHPDHPMLRIPVPLSGDMPFSRRFGRDLHKISKHFDYLLHPSENSSGDKRARGDAHCGHTRRQNGDRKFKGCPIGANLLSENMMKNFFHAMDAASKFMPSQGMFSTAEHQATPNQPNVDAPVDEKRIFMEILRNGLTSFIDPLGADASYSGSPGPREPVPEPSAERPSSSSSSNAQPTVNPAQPESSQAQPKVPAQKPKMGFNGQLLHMNNDERLPIPESYQNLLLDEDALRKKCEQAKKQCEIARRLYEVSKNGPILMHHINEITKDVMGGGDSAGEQEVKIVVENGNEASGGIKEDSPVLDNTWTVINSRENMPAPQEAESASSSPPTASVATDTQDKPGTSHTPMQVDPHVEPGKIYPAIPVMPITPAGQKGFFIDDSCSEGSSYSGYFSDNGHFHSYPHRYNR